MEDPVSRRLVLLRTWLEQIAHDGYRSGATHTLARLHGLRETEHLPATGQEDLDQLCADESVGFCDKRGRPCVACHEASVECERGGAHSSRTGLVRRSYNYGSKMNRL